MMHGIELDIASWRSVHGGWLVLSCTQINERRQLGSVLQALPFFFLCPAASPPPTTHTGGDVHVTFSLRINFFFKMKLKITGAKEKRNQSEISLWLLLC